MLSIQLVLTLLLTLSNTPLISAFTAIGHSTTTTTSSSSSSSSSKLNMSTASDVTVQNEVKVGDTLPNTIVMTELVDVDGKPDTINLYDLCTNKKVLIFGVPGAFTPGCSKSHLPSFITAYDELKTKYNIDIIICMATNDAYTMEAWGRTSGGSAAGIRFLSDNTGELTKTWGLAMENPVGIRTKRFTLILDNNVVTHYFSSAKQASDTWAPAVLSAL